MKNLFLTLVTILTTTILFSQDNIWVRIPNYESKSKEVSQSLSNFNIKEIKQAFSASRNQELKEVYQITCDCDVNDIIQFTSKNSLFVNPEIGPQYQTLDTPNDYSISGQDWALNSIKAEGAWNITHGDSSIVIAITDANYYQYHEELAMKVDLISQNSNTNYTHGTAVAITAAGNTNNGCGKSSIGYNSHLQLRAMDYNEILEATYSGSKIVNASWASSCYYNYYAQQVITEAWSNGVTIVASAGNGSTCGGANNLVYPASFDHVISVSSIGSGDNHERFIGDPNSTHQHNPMVDIVAPGYDVLLSTAPGQYMTGNGTSFASPMVSGTIALMLSVNKCLTPDQIEWILKQSADSTIYNYNQLYIGQLGSGKLNSQKAVEMAKRFNTFNAELKSEVVCSINKRQLFLENGNGAEPLKYEWSNNSISDKIFVDTNNTYWVEVTDNKGCKLFSESQFDTYDEMQIQSDIHHVTCNGLENGHISVEITGGYGSIDYDWSNYDTTSQASNLKAKDYYVSIKDEAGCHKFETFTITQPEKLETSLSYTQPSQTTFGSINLDVVGGTSPYTFQWNHGETSQNLSNIVADFYEVLVTDVNGCMSSENVILENEIESVTGLEELSKQSIIVYPNPSEGPITIVAVGEVEILTTTGQLVERLIVNGKIDINLSKGVYFAKVGDFVNKFVIR